MQIDEEFKNLIPKLSDEEFKQLEENIIKEGCRESIVVWNSTIIDGHNRYEICNKHNIDFKTTNKDFSNREEAKMWIIKNQFGRRNLSVYDRSVLALKLEDLFKEKAKQNQGTRTDLCQTSDKSLDEPINDSIEKLETDKDFLQKSAKSLKEIVPIDTRKEIAKIAGTSHDTIAKVKKIEEKAPEEVKKKVKSGEMSINQAYGYAKTYEYLENEIGNNQNEIQESEQQKQLREETEREMAEIRKQHKIQQFFMSTISNAMILEIDEEHIEAWFSDMNIEERQEEMSSIEKAINNLQQLKTEANQYLNKNKIKVVK